MKTITTRAFFHRSAARLIKPGESVVVTNNGRPAFVVSKPKGNRPAKTAAEIRREARAIFGDLGTRKKVDLQAIVRGLR